MVPHAIGAKTGFQRVSAVIRAISPRAKLAARTHGSTLRRDVPDGLAIEVPLRRRYRRGDVMTYVKYVGTTRNEVSDKLLVNYACRKTCYPCPIFS